MTSIANAGTDALRHSLGSAALLPGDAGYDQARTLWNGRFEPRPAAVVRCRRTADVVAAVRFAAEHGLPLSVRSGGHSYAGHAVQDGALALDLSSLNDVQVDAEARTARVGAGAKWAEVDARTQAAGLATTGATVSSVGVAGFLLGGGTGYLARSFGLGVDNLLAVEIVTADGTVQRASDSENPELFWAVRGAGANFGVVTAFELRLHPVGPEVVTVQAWHTLDDGAAALRFYRDYMARAPDEVNLYAFLLRVPPVAPFPEPHHGKPAVAIIGMHCGDAAAGEEALQPVVEAGAPFFAGHSRVRYADMQQAFDAGMPDGLRWYSRAHYLPQLSDDVVSLLLQRAASLPGAYTMTYLEHSSGAVARVDSAAMAFPHRDASFGLHILPGWTDPDDDAAMMSWARELHTDLAPHATGGAYVNLVGEDQDPGEAGAYGANLQRLRQLKARWDPDNLFRGNHNLG